MPSGEVVAPGAQLGLVVELFLRAAFILEVVDELVAEVFWPVVEAFGSELAVDDGKVVLLLPGVVVDEGGVRPGEPGAPGVPGVPGAAVLGGAALPGAAGAWAATAPARARLATSAALKTRPGFGMGGLLLLRKVQVNRPAGPKGPARRQPFEPFLEPWPHDPG
ncbi:MAG TPA: hypothetical protein VFE18_06195 [Phenylobacterium sp.]|uniref:hypothetical protein n=1 Tax=Phenylobacterium sp. TaxID=1871053 RepID=UPI002D4BDD1A|nr:hypothetical protein [Phenylobacterium sp.]HZZ67745.1 hypothetical protein [Phenylobacterium sp.]